MNCFLFDAKRYNFFLKNYEINGKWLMMHNSNFREVKNRKKVIIKAMIHIKDRNQTIEAEMKMMFR